MTFKFESSSGMDQLKKFFESGNINFLIGSGSAIKSIDSLGNLEVELTSNMRDYQGDHSESTRDLILEQLNGFLTSIKYPNEILLNGRFGEFENINQTLLEYIRFLRVIYNLLLNRGANKLPKKINVFTTNYDLFFEHALETLKIPYNDGGTGVFKRNFSSKNFQRRMYKLSDSYSYQYEEPVINIIKLHGSINWSIERDSVLISNDILVPEITKNCIDNNSYIKESINFPIILPTKQKFVRTVMEHIYYDLSRLYSNELEREQSVLFAFGFSFEDEHIRSITKRALGNPHLTLIIFPFSFEDERKLLAHFETHSNVKVVRINSTQSNAQQIELVQYSLLFANGEMDNSKRSCIDFELFSKIFEHIFENVSESKVFS